MTLKQISHWINGEAVWPEGCTTRPKHSPLDGSVLYAMAEGDAADVDAAVSAARAALNGAWGRMGMAERSRVLAAVADGIEQRLPELVAAEAGDTGKPEALLRGGEVPRSASNFRDAVELLKQQPGDFFETSTPDGAGAINYTVRSALGVVAVISPWNSPLLLMTSKVGAALACGNTVVVKPSEETPRTAVLLGQIMREAGVPDGVYNVVLGAGSGSAGELLTRHPGVDAITFTGETRTGAAIMKAAADGARPVSMEMGGKCPAIIFADCDFEAAVAGTLRSAFLNCGQICLGTERIYVERPIFERFVAALKAGAEALTPGLPADPQTSIGPLISRSQRDKVLSYYRLALEDGATVVTGGGLPSMPAGLETGNWIEPTIWTGLPPSSRVLQEEIFGPCCHVAPFDSEDEVVGRANETVYGLAATVWTTQLARSHRLARRLKVGIVWVNSWLLRDTRTPFGGARQSGIGREGGVHSLAFFTELTNVCIKL